MEYFIININLIFFVQVVANQFFNSNQQIPKINPVSTQLLQTLNRDPRLRKVENPMKSPPHDNKQQVLKNKEEKKLDKPKRDSYNKHRDLKRKEISPTQSPSKKILSRKPHKKIDRKDRNVRNEKYHKRRDEKNSKESDIKKKSMSPSVKMQQNDTVIIHHDTLPKDNDKLIKNEPKIDIISTEIPVIEPIETNVPKEKDIITEEVGETKINNSKNLVSELPKSDSPLEDSDSLKRLHMYMQTMKKSPEPSIAQPLELKNDTDIRAVKSNQSKIKMSDQIYIIVKFIVGDLLLFLNKLDTFLRQNKMKTILPFHNVLLSRFFYTYMCVFMNGFITRQPFGGY